MRKRFILIMAGLGACFLLLTQTGFVPAPSGETKATDVGFVEPDPPQELPAGNLPTATRYYLGVYLSDISGFDLKEGRFSADLQVWMKWAGDSASPPLRFTNGEVENMEEIAFESENGWNSRLYRVQGTFRGTFPVHNFPFDNQQIRISMDMPQSQGMIAPDLAGSGMSQVFSITGWEYDPLFKAEVKPSAYYSDFGSVYNEGKPYEVNEISFVLELRRPHIAYIFKFMLPLFIIILMAMVALIVPPDQIEVRAGIGITALLTSIAFQNAMADLIPEVSYLVIADKLFLISYVVIVITFIQTVLSFLKARTEAEADMKTARRRDYRVVTGVFISSIIATVLVLSVKVKYDKPVPPLAAAPADSVVSAKDRLLIAVGSFSSLNSNNVKSNLLNRGLLYDVQGVKVPFLAEARPELTNEYVKFLPDGGMGVIWRLRPDLRWSDGTSMTSKDMLFSAEVERETYTSLREITEVDERTIELIFADRQPGNLAHFEMYPAHVYDSLFYKYGHDTLSVCRKWALPVTSGPYRIVKYDSANTTLLAEVNPFFAGKQPYIREICVFQSPTTTLDLALKDSLDMVFFISPESNAKLEGTGKYDFSRARSDQMLILMPDLTLPIFQDVNVRKAIACAIDREKIMQIFTKTGAEANGNIRPSSDKEYLPDTSKQWRYNPALAKKYLAAAQTKERKIRLIGFFRDTTKTESRALLLMGKQLEAVGFDVEVVKESKMSAISARRNATNHGGLLATNTTYLNSVYPFLNVPYILDDYRPDSVLWPMPPLMRQLAFTYQTSMYVERKTVTCQELQAMYYDLLPTIPVCSGVNIDARRKGIVGPAPYVASLNFWNVEHWYFAGEEKMKPDTLQGTAEK